MSDKNKIANQYAGYYYRMHLEKDIKNIRTNYNIEDINGKKELVGRKSEHFATNLYLNKSNNMKSCLDFWAWDKYDKNKVLDLKRVNRCKDNRFCPNCRKVDLAMALKNFSPKYKMLIEKGYYPYLLTLTTPNVTPEMLDLEVKNFSKAFSKLWKWIYINKDRRFKKCLINATACIRVLEVTYNSYANTYNPHYHIILFLKENVTNYEKTIQGPFRKKSNNYVFFSEIEIQLMRLWYMAINNISIRKMDTVPYGWYDNNGNYTGLYLVNLEPIESEKGIYEVFKYTFKDTDIKNYDVFTTIYDALYRKRIRQGHGELFNLKLEFEDDDLEKESDILEFLEIDKKETPVELFIQGLGECQKELFTSYQNYRKISRFQISEIVEQIQD